MVEKRSLTRRCRAFVENVMLASFRQIHIEALQPLDRYNEGRNDSLQPVFLGEDDLLIPQSMAVSGETGSVVGSDLRKLAYLISCKLPQPARSQIHDKWAPGVLRLGKRSLRYC